MASSNPMGGLFSGIEKASAASADIPWIGEGEYICIVRKAYYRMGRKGVLFEVELDVMAHIGGKQSHTAGDAVKQTFAASVEGWESRLKGFIVAVGEIPESSIVAEFSTDKEGNRTDESEYEIVQFFPEKGDTDSESVLKGASCRILGRPITTKSGNEITAHSNYTGPKWSELLEMVNDGTVPEKALKKAMSLEDLEALAEAEAEESGS